MAPSLASAATLTNAGGTLAYAGAPGKVSLVDFVQTGTTVRVTRYPGSGDDDPITFSGCTEVTPGQVYDCAGVASVVADGGDLDDSLSATGFFGGALTSIPATISGGDGDDNVTGGGAADNVSGGNGDDGASGQAGNDTVSGGTGDDFVSGGAGDDGVDGGAGDDNVSGDAGNDDVHGGTGIDSSNIFGAANPAPAVNGSLDDQANDGGPGETDNIHTDVEDLFGSSFNTGAGADDGVVTLRGNAGSNFLGVGSGKGNLDAGAGNDSLAGGNLDDTINSVDGFADRVTCGAGNDTVTADTLDNVSDSCENVTRIDVGNAAQDKQPTVVWTAPADNATLSTSKANTLSVNATDDKGIAKVQFLVGSRIVCEDTTAPYSCDYKPQGSEGGRNTLVAIAIDTAQQTATALKAAVVDRFTPKIGLTLTPRSDKRAPYRFRARGKLTLPAGMSKTTGCSSGTFSVSVKAGSRTISTRRVNIKKDCSFSSTVRFTSKSRFGKAKSLKFVARFSGNAALKVASSKSTTGRVR